MKLYVVHDKIANEDVSCFFMQNEATLRRSFLDCLEDVKKGKGRKPSFLRDGFSLYEYEQVSNPDWCMTNEIEILNLLPELRNED
nr:MAG TPA: hypothetical protein [Microviridae sp.]